MRLIRAFLAICKSFFLTVGLITTLVFTVKFLFTSDRRVEVLGSEQKAILTLDLSGTLQEEITKQNFFKQAMQAWMGKEQGVSLLHVDAALSEASKDPRVVGVLLKISSLEGSMSNFEELRQALSKFRKSGKKIYAWIPSADTKEYFLASAADQVFLAPTGSLTIPGPALQNVYFGEALRKLGIDIEFIRAGSFKSAVEPFTLNHPSNAASEMSESLRKSIAGILAEYINADRSVRADATLWFKQGLFSANEALTQDLVDQLGYYEEAKTQVEKDLSATFFPYPDYEYSVLQGSTVSSSAPGIAVIEATGEIRMDDDVASDNIIGPKRLSKELEWAEKNDQVKAVLLKINSPGGSALASDLIAERIAHVKSKKPVVAYLSTVAASGGYYIAALADKIIAPRSAITGSIGVFAIIPKFTKFEEKYGISFHTFSGSDRKNLFNPGSASSIQDTDILQKQILRTYDEFKAIVSKGRTLDPAKVEDLAGGKVWTGSQALELELIDQVGSLRDAINEAKTLGRFSSEEKVPLLFWQPEISSFSECISHLDRCFPDSRASIEDFFKLSKGQLLLKKLESIIQSFKDEPIQALWPASLLDDRHYSL